MIIFINVISETKFTEMQKKKSFMQNAIAIVYFKTINNLKIRIYLQKDFEKKDERSNNVQKILRMVKSGFMQYSPLHINVLTPELI